ncbi:hypothetical protein BC834DRAFT_868835 [Gloeopeniophorella convolvens]|nr:hypothetical protein BC834DRAFT_868835 [Gloeopeniophorella convolvens]
MADKLDAFSSEQPLLVYQVGGHKGIQTTGGGSLLIKAALPIEHEFYRSTLANPALVSLRPWVPTYLGTLRLEGHNTAEGFASVEGVSEDEKESLVLENVAHRFRRPNILDVKLGTVLYDEDASPEKKERMQKAAEKSTSRQTGIRLTGFQVFENKSSQPTVVPKSYGYSINPAELPAGIARFFPVCSPVTDTLEQQVGEAAGGGLPGKLLLPILRSIRSSIQHIRDALGTIELRMVGSSLLIIYEGDWERAREGVQWLTDHPEGFESDEESTEEDISDEGSEDHEQSDQPRAGENVPTAAAAEGDEGSDDDGSSAGPPCVVRLIDFAHTRMRPGQGPDTGVLTGLDTLLMLLDGRIASVEEQQP